MMEKRYYYLNPARTEPLGPHTITELSTKVLKGELSTSTEVAAEGDKRWVPLGQLLTQVPLPPAALPPIPNSTAASRDELPPVPGYEPTPTRTAIQTDKPAGHCPACAQELVTEAGQLPPNCPHCGEYLRPEKDTMWQHIRAALVRPLTWRGRSPRREFWGSWLFNLLTYIPFLVVALTVISAFTFLTIDKIPANELNFELVAAAPDMIWAWVALGLLVAATVYFLLVLWAATARRLHDTGRSAWWLIISMVLSIGYQVAYVYELINYLSSINWRLLFAIEDESSLNARIEEISNQINLIGYGGACGALYLVTTIVGLTIFIFLVTDSEPGPNKYGPCCKYPHA